MWVGKVNCLWHNASMPETLPRPCSVAAALALIGEKWSLLVIRELAFRVHRFDAIARNNSLSRREFGRIFSEAVGLPPKLFARITRFQMLVEALLSTDVSRWAGVSTAAGFYDQAHMINEFRSFAGAPPRTFFQPRGEANQSVQVLVRGRPSEWLACK